MVREDDEAVIPSRMPTPTTHLHPIWISGACDPNFVCSQFFCARLKSVVDDWMTVRQEVGHNTPRLLESDVYDLDP